MSSSSSNPKTSLMEDVRRASAVESAQHLMMVRSLQHIPLSTSENNYMSRSVYRHISTFMSFSPFLSLFFFLPVSRTESHILPPSFNLPCIVPLFLVEFTLQQLTFFSPSGECKNRNSVNYALTDASTSPARRRPSRKKVASAHAWKSTWTPTVRRHISMCRDSSVI